MTASEITYLVRHLNLHSKLISPGKDKTRVLLEASANIDEIESILLQQLVGELGVLDHADHADSQLVANGLLDLDGEGSLVGGTGVWVLGWVVSSGGDIQDIHTLSARMPASLAVSSPVQDSGMSAASSSQSVAEMRKKRGMSLGMIARVSSVNSMARRVRFSKLPP
jgi:hypothetical protein